METKFTKKVSYEYMKDKILEKSKELVLKYGLNFKVDDIAKELKISKKTIYQYYKDKYELAHDLFISVYELAIFKMENSKNLESLLFVYRRVLIFSDNSIYNKNSLNDSVIKISIDYKAKCEEIFLKKVNEISKKEIDETLLKVINKSLYSIDKEEVKRFSEIVERALE